MVMSTFRFLAFFVVAVINTGAALTVLQDGGNPFAAGFHAVCAVLVTAHLSHADRGDS